MGGTHRGSTVQLSWRRPQQGCYPKALSFIRSRPGLTVGLRTSALGRIPLLLEDQSPPPPRGGEGRGSDCRCTVPRKGAISQSPARLPLVPSALGGQTLPEALGSDVNIPYPKPQRAGVGGKRRGQSWRVSPYNSAPQLETFRLLRLPAASGTGLTGTQRSRSLLGWRPITRSIAPGKLLLVNRPRHFLRTRDRSPQK